MFTRLMGPEDDNTGGGGGDLGGDTTPNDAPMDMDQTLRDTLASIRSRDEGGEESSAPAGTGRTRGPNGRFAQATAAAAAPPATDETGTPAPEETGDPEAAAAAVVASEPVNVNPDGLEYVDNAGNKHAADITKPPVSWRTEAKAEYDKLPEWAKREAHKRENDFHTGVQQYKTAANFAVSMGNEFKPYEALLRSQNWTPQALTKDFMNSHYRLSTGAPAERSAEVIRVAGMYGISVNDLQAALATVQSAPAGQTPPAPTREYIELKRELDQIKQQSTAAEEQAIQSEIRQFETDGKHPHFKEVAKAMGALMSAGEATTMQEAYDKATWANPQIRTKLQAQQADEQRKIAADKAAAARKAASVNVVARGKHPSAAPVGSMDDTLRATYRRLNGGG